MTRDQLYVERDPAPADVAFLADRINEFNITTTGIAFDAALAILVRDSEGAIIAGIAGWTWGGCCEIRALWVHEQLRGQGLGTKLLAAAEREAVARNCSVITLDTHSFQAPGFYTKCGYAIVGTVEDYPRGYQKLFFRKTLHD